MTGRDFLIATPEMAEDVNGWREGVLKQFEKAGLIVEPKHQGDDRITPEIRGVEFKETIIDAMARITPEMIDRIEARIMAQKRPRIDPDFKPEKIPVNEKPFKFPDCFRRAEEQDEGGGLLIPDIVRIIYSTMPVRYPDRYPVMIGTACARLPGEKQIFRKFRGILGPPLFPSKIYRGDRMNARTRRLLKRWSKMRREPFVEAPLPRGGD